METEIDTTQYTTKHEVRQDAPYLGDYTCMPRRCPKCGAKETWLSNDVHVGGRGYLRFWHCEWCNHAEEASYFQFKEFYWCFDVPHAGQHKAALAYANGATQAQAAAIGKAAALEAARVAMALRVWAEETGISLEVAP